MVDWNLNHYRHNWAQWGMRAVRRQMRICTFSPTLRSSRLTACLLVYKGYINNLRVYAGVFKNMLCSNTCCRCRIYMYEYAFCACAVISTQFSFSWFSRFLFSRFFPCFLCLLLCVWFHYPLEDLSTWVRFGPNWARLAPNGTKICDFLRSVFYSFWLVEPKWTENWS